MGWFKLLLLAGAVYLLYKNREWIASSINNWIANSQINREFVQKAYLVLIPLAAKGIGILMPGIKLKSLISSAPPVTSETTTYDMLDPDVQSALDEWELDNQRLLPDTFQQIQLAELPQNVQDSLNQNKLYVEELELSN